PIYTERRSFVHPERPGPAHTKPPFRPGRIPLPAPTRWSRAMKRTVLLAALAALLPLTALRANEPPEAQLGFALKLRDRGYSALALEAPEKLQKAAPKGLAARLPLELARTRVALARQRDPSQRLALFNEARKDLDRFLAANPKGPEATKVTVELARLE